MHRGFGETVMNALSALADIAAPRGEVQGVLPWTPEYGEEHLAGAFETAVRLIPEHPHALLEPDLPEGAAPPPAMDATHTTMAANLLIHDMALRQLRFDLVPRMLSEEHFWDRYFSQVERVKAECRRHAVDSDGVWVRHRDADGAGGAAAAPPPPSPFSAPSAADAAPATAAGPQAATPSSPRAERAPTPGAHSPRSSVGGEGASAAPPPQEPPAVRREGEACGVGRRVPSPPPSPTDRVEPRAAGDQAWTAAVAEAAPAGLAALLAGIGSSALAAGAAVGAAGAWAAQQHQSLLQWEAMRREGDAAGGEGSAGMDACDAAGAAAPSPDSTCSECVALLRLADCYQATQLLGLQCMAELKPLSLSPAEACAHAQAAASGGAPSARVALSVWRSLSSLGHDAAAVLAAALQVGNAASAAVAEATDAATGLVLQVFELDPSAGGLAASATGAIAGGDAPAANDGRCLLVRLASVVSRGAATLADFALLWDEALQELHIRWARSDALPGSLPLRSPLTALPLQRCLLLLALSAAERAEQRRRSPAGHAGRSGSQGAGEAPAAPVVRDGSTGMRFARLGALAPLDGGNAADEDEVDGIWVPQLQDFAEAVFSVGGGAGARHSWLLLSSRMSAFKAANPGFSFTSFLAWHAARWGAVSVPSEGAQGSAEANSSAAEAGHRDGALTPGDVSPAASLDTCSSPPSPSPPGAAACQLRDDWQPPASAPRSAWAVLFDRAMPTPAAKQTPLVDAEALGEAQLAALGGMAPAAVAGQLFAALAYKHLTGCDRRGAAASETVHQLISALAVCYDDADGGGGEAWFAGREPLAPGGWGDAGEALMVVATCLQRTQQMMHTSAAAGGPAVDVATVGSGSQPAADVLGAAGSGWSGSESDSEGAAEQALLMRAPDDARMGGAEGLAVQAAVAAGDGRARSAIAAAPAAARIGAAPGAGEGWVLV